MRKPKVLEDWEKAGPPRVCFNCDHQAGGRCAIYDAVPPDSFQETAGACDKWELGIPF